jgi:hypothetical protein
MTTAKTIRYEVSDFSDKQTSTLREAREIAKKWALKNYKANLFTRFVLIYKFDIPGNPYAGTTFVEKWRIDADGILLKKEA